jgi:Zn-dependent protease
MPRPCYMPFTVLTLFGLARIVHIPTDLALILMGTAWFTVLVHELGHALAVKCAGGRVLDLIPTPFMGITCHTGDDRRQLAWVALAGPLAGAAVSVTALLALQVIAPPHTAATVALQRVLWAVLADHLVFNLIPWGTLDGAYVLRGLRERRAEAAFVRHTERVLMEAWESVHPAPRATTPTAASVAAARTPRDARELEAELARRWVRPRTEGARGDAGRVREREGS